MKCGAKITIYNEVWTMGPNWSFDPLDVCASRGLNAHFGEYADGGNGSYDRRFDYGTVDRWWTYHVDDDG